MEFLGIVLEKLWTSLSGVVFKEPTKIPSAS